ncbi:hypothetical protein BN946_scf185007.g15 [Trametes cinnabarina]|uniref:Pentacotripeptide-repeat region of PRORP domain-containing protein n=1 Tax=Pycnoporus cinnabarinus TaxID=5643 RepID=A0A060SFI0_PYCCI|nr:hypothetical protein BN946_scf185007.g15 [Trametes cinnabarina]
MFLRRAFVRGRRSTLGLLVPPARLRHSPPPPPTLTESNFSESVAPGQLASSDAPPTGLRYAVKNFYHTIAHTKLSPRAPYNDLLWHVNNNKGTSSPLLPESQQLLWRAFALLAQSRSEDDYDILVDGVWRFARLQNTSVDEYAQELFSRIITSRKLKPAYKWLLASLKIPAVTYTTELSTWHALLELAAELRDLHVIEEALRQMRPLGLVLTNETVYLIFQVAFRDRPSSRTYQYRPPPFPFIRSLINILPVYGIPFHHDTLRTIVDGYTRDGQEGFAQEAEFIYVSALGNSQDVAHDYFNKLLADLALRKGRDHVLRACRRFTQLGFVPSEDTFFAVFGQSNRFGDLAYWQHQLRMKVTAKVILHLMDRRAEQNASVLELYRFAQSNGITLTSDMLYRVIKPLLTSRGPERPTEQAIDRALDLYRDFVARSDRAKEANEGPGKQVSENFFSPHSDAGAIKARKQRDRHPSVATYQLLIRALTVSMNIEKYLPVAVSLIEDMQRFGLRLDPQTTASVLILLMHSSSTPEEAFEMYRIMCVSEQSNGASLNEEGYVAVLDAFCRLPTWPGGVPSTQLYFSIINDMRERGVPIGPKVYTVILAQMGKLATVALKSGDIVAQETIAKAIMRIHNNVTLNPSFTPDTQLYNQLMDAYQRAGCFIEACRVWQMLFTSGLFSDVSVVIILDACAYAGAYDMAVRIYSMLKDVGFPMNLKVWNTYLECLCRLGKLDEAMKVACLEMTGRDDGVEPDKESVRILLKFAMKTNQEMEVRGRLKRYLPRVCNSMPEFAPS